MPVKFSTRGKPNEFVKASSPAGAAEGQAVVILVALREAVGGMVAMLQESQQPSKEALEFFLQIRKVRDLIEVELQEIDAGLALAEAKVVGV